MNIRRIRYFLTVAEEKHFGRAAELIHISQPPLSQQIRLLEKDIGVELFVRTTRQVDLTEAGEVFFRDAKKALQELERAVAYAQLVQRGEGGVLRLGFVSTSTVKLLPEVVRRFRDRYPDANVECLHLTSREQVQALLDRTMDIGFLRNPPDDKNLESRVIKRERLFAALPANHALCRLRTIQISALKHEPFIMWDQRQTGGIASTVLTLCKKHKFVPKTALEVVDPHALLSLVAGGLGVAIVPESALHMKQEGLEYKPIRAAEAYSDLALAWRKDNKRGILKRFIAVATEVAERDPASGRKPKT